MSSSARQPIKIKTRKRKRPASSKVTETKGISENEVPSILAKALMPPQKEVENPTKSKHSDDDFEDMNEIDIEAICDLPSDIVLAIRSLIQQHSYATIECGCEDEASNNSGIKFVLKPMIRSALYTNISSDDGEQVSQIKSAMASTGFYKDLNSLCSEGKIKILQMQGMNGEEDECIMEMNEYLRAVRNVLSKSDLSQHDKSVLQLFLSCQTEKNHSSLFRGTCVMGQELQQALERINRKNEEYLLKEDQWIDTLVNLQFLLPRRPMGAVSTMLKSHASYWFTLPGMGIAAALITEGRRRMRLRLQRAPNREIKRNSLEMNARGGMMGPFHVRDLLARNVVKLKETANGQFIKLPCE